MEAKSLKIFRVIFVPYCSKISAARHPERPPLCRKQQFL